MFAVHLALGSAPNRALDRLGSSPGVKLVDWTKWPTLLPSALVACSANESSPTHYNAQLRLPQPCLSTWSGLHLCYY